MLWFAYNLLFAVAFVVLMPHFLCRMWRRGGYGRNFWQRLGFFSDEVLAKIRERPRVWVHAASVGEAYVALRFMETWRRAAPDVAFVFTVITSTGHAIAEDLIDERDVLLYFPLDFPPVVRRVLNVYRPRAVVLIERELWPNMIRLSHARGIPVALINGRLSERSARRYRAVGAFFRAGVNCMDLVCVQSVHDEKRFLSLGTRRELVRVTGSAKYDSADADESKGDRARSVLKAAGVSSGGPLLVGGCTWPGEDEALLRTYREMRESVPGLRCVIVPRHFEKADGVAAIIERIGLSYVRRSAVGDAGDGSKDLDVLLVDTTGELDGYYACADVVFVGKSLLWHGGQSIIQPAQFGKAIIVGPNMENFEGVMDDFLGTDAIMQVADARGLAQACRSLITDEELRRGYGRRAKAAVENGKGAIESTVSLVRETMQNTS